MNCVHPSAPALDGPMLQPKPDSISVIAARIDQRRPNALAAAFHVGTSGPEPWQRGAALSPVRTCGCRPAFGRAASARSEAPAFFGMLTSRDRPAGFTVATLFGAAAAGVPLRKLVFSQPERTSMRSAVAVSRPAPQV